MDILTISPPLKITGKPTIRFGICTLPSAQISALYKACLDSSTETSIYSRHLLFNNTKNNHFLSPLWVELLWVELQPETLNINIQLRKKADSLWWHHNS